MTASPRRMPAPSAAAAIAALESEALQDSLDREGFAVTAPIVDAATCAELAQLYASARRDVSLHRDHGAAWIRQRGVQIFCAALARPGDGAAAGILRTAGADRQCVERAPGTHRRLAGGSRFRSGAVRRCRSNAPHSAAPALRPGRLQLPASGSVWRNSFSPASHSLAGSSGHRFRRWRIDPGRAAPAAAIEADGAAAGSGSLCGDPREGAAGRERPRRRQECRSVTASPRCIADFAAPWG